MKSLVENALSRRYPALNVHFGDGASTEMIAAAELELEVSLIQAPVMRLELT